MECRKKINALLICMFFLSCQTDSLHAGFPPKNKLGNYANYQIGLLKNVQIKSIKLFGYCITDFISAIDSETVKILGEKVLKCYVSSWG